MNTLQTELNISYQSNIHLALNSFQPIFYSLCQNLSKITHNDSGEHVVFMYKFMPISVIFFLVFAVEVHRTKQVISYK